MKQVRCVSIIFSVLWDIIIVETTPHGESLHLYLFMHYVWIIQDNLCMVILLFWCQNEREDEEANQSQVPPAGVVNWCFV